MSGTPRCGHCAAREVSAVARGDGVGVGPGAGLMARRRAMRAAAGPDILQDCK
ncbi:hypothetical protein DA2_1376 [Desulfovibrio sp. A2]|nr:hypothetical protein DA2_1376 [Desulfovibrio sp. A2]